MTEINPLKTLVVINSCQDINQLSVALKYAELSIKVNTNIGLYKINTDILKAWKLKWLTINTGK